MSNYFTPRCVVNLTVYSLRDDYKPVPLPGRVAQSVTCLVTDACLTADPGVASSIPVRSHTFVEIDHEMISAVILLPSADPFKKGCGQLRTNYWLTACSSLPRKKCG